MNTLQQILGIAAAAFIIWYLIHVFRNNPTIFSKASLTKSLGTMGLLALILIIFIAVMVVLLRISG